MNFRSTELQPLNKTSALWKISHKKHSHKVDDIRAVQSLGFNSSAICKKKWRPKRFTDPIILQIMLLYFMPKQLSIAQPSAYAGQNFPVARAITTQSFLLQNKEAKLLGFLLLYSLRPRSTITMQLFHCKIKISKILKRYSHKAGDVQTLQSR